MTDEEYFRHKYISASTLKCFAGPASRYSKRQALHKFETPSTPSPAMQLGSLFHKAVEIGYVDAEPCPFENFTTKASREWRDSQTGPIYMQKDIDTANCMIEAMKLMSPDIWDLARSNGVEKERAVFNEELGLKCKQDLFDPSTGLIVDWKSCADPTPYGIRRACDNFNLDLQCAHYLKTDVDANDFMFVFVQTAPPYEVVIVPGAPILERGRRKWEIAFERYKKRLDGVLDAVVVDPSWEQTEHIEDDLEDVTI